jgi:carboxymethylenebutenolidase
VELHRYVAEEIATDCAEGLLTRREALRRLSLIGLSAMSATALLAACGGDGDGDGGARATTSTGPATGTTPTSLAPGQGVEAAEPITIAGRHGVLGTAQQPKGAVLVIHEIFGLTDHFRSLTARLAADGYTAITLDLVPEGTSAVGDQGRVVGIVTGRPEADVIADLRMGLDELSRRAPGSKLGVMGFCFGGGYTWRLLAAGEPRLAAAIPFYGPAPDAPDFSRSQAAVLAVYGELDARVNGTRDLAADALRRAGLVHEVRTFAGADHGFFNDTGARYNAAAATEAYQAVLAWFGRYLRS